MGLVQTIMDGISDELVMQKAQQGEASIIGAQPIEPLAAEIESNPLYHLQHLELSPNQQTYVSPDEASEEPNDDEDGEVEEDEPNFG